MNYLEKIFKFGTFLKRENYGLQLNLYNKRRGKYQSVWLLPRDLRAHKYIKELFDLLKEQTRTANVDSEHSIQQLPVEI